MKNTSKTRRAIALICLLCGSFMQMIAQTKESVTVAYDFSPSTEVYGMTFVGENTYIQDTDIKNKDVTLSLRNSICYFKSKYGGYLRIQGNPDIGYTKGSIKLTVPNECSITNITFTAAPYNSKFKIVNLGNDKTNYKLNCSSGKTDYINRTIPTTSITFTPSSNDNSYITKIAVTYTRNKPDVAFEEKSSATTQTISDNIGNTSCTINRAFNNNYMNSLCVPFDLTCEKIRDIFGEGTIIYRYVGSSNGNIYLNSSSTADVPAGTPIIIKPSLYVESPVFTDIIISDKEPQEVKHGDISFCGTYVPYEMNTDGSEVFLNTSQTFSKPKAGQNTMRGFRCYFRKTDNGVKDMSAIFDNEETDCIKETQNSSIYKSHPKYNIYGCYTDKSLQQLAPGIYIINGKKILIGK